jgi:hypothetical protein
MTKRNPKKKVNNKTKNKINKTISMKLKESKVEILLINTIDKVMLPKARMMKKKLI